MPHLRNPRGHRWIGRYLLKGFRNKFEPYEYKWLRQKYVRTFLGYCFGIGIKQRGPHDKHVSMVFMTEDDGSWYDSPHGGANFSSHWLAEIQGRLADLERWLNQNCIKEKGGWRFK